MILKNNFKFQAELAAEVPYADLYTDPQYKTRVDKKIKEMKRVARNCKFVHQKKYRKELTRLKEQYSADGRSAELFELIGNFFSHTIPNQIQTWNNSYSNIKKRRNFKMQLFTQKDAKTPQDMFALSKYWKVNCKINFSALFLVAEYEEGDPDTDDESDEKEVTFSIKP